MVAAVVNNINAPTAVVNKKQAFILDPKHRMEKWKKKSESLMKQAWELHTLCDTPTFIVITPPAGASDPSCSKFAVWSNNNNQNVNGAAATMRRMIDVYKSRQRNQILKNRRNSSANSPIENRAYKKARVNKNNNVNNDQAVRMMTGSVSCGGGLGLTTSIQTATNVNNVWMDTRIDGIQIDNNVRKRKWPFDSAGADAIIATAEDTSKLVNTTIEASVAAAKGMEKGDVDDVIDFGFLDDFTDIDDASFFKW